MVIVCIFIVYFVVFVLVSCYLFSIVSGQFILLIQIYFDLVVFFSIIIEMYLLEILIFYVKKYFLFVICHLDYSVCFGLEFLNLHVVRSDRPLLSEYHAMFKEDTSLAKMI